MRNNLRQNKFLLPLTLCFLTLILSACQPTKEKPSSISKAQAATGSIYRDSTHYFLNRTASISMRATLSNNSQTIIEGYKLQFRTIRNQNVAITDASIVAGGQYFSIANKEFFIDKQRAITLQLELNNTQLIQQQSDAVLRFKADGESLLFIIQNHQLQPFLP